MVVPWSVACCSAVVAAAAGAGGGAAGGAAAALAVSGTELAVRYWYSPQLHMTHHYCLTDPA